MSHLETLVSEFLEWEGFIVRRNAKVGRRAKGGWEMELDVVAFHPTTRDLVHYEPSLDSNSWATREKRFRKKFEAGRKHILPSLFSWLPRNTPIRQFAVLASHPKGRDTLAGAALVSADELVAEIRRKIGGLGPMSSNAIPERFPLLRTIQMLESGYYRALPRGLPRTTAPSRSAPRP